MVQTEPQNVKNDFTDLIFSAEQTDGISSWF